MRTADCQVDLCNIKHEQPPDINGYDLLGIGLPAYYFRPPFNIMDYVNSLPSLEGISTFVFMLCGSYCFNASNPIRQTLSRKGGQEVGYFKCYGAGFFLGYLREGYLFSPDHPTKKELLQAEAFGREIVAHLTNKQYIRPKYDKHPPIIYCLERFLTNRWLIKHIYSKMFKVDIKMCTTCGLCIRVCPNRNIIEGKGGIPVCGSNCLGCLSCEMKCPEEAITSVLRLPIFRLFAIHNVRHASRDPSLDYVRVIHSHGQTKKV